MPRPVSLPSAGPELYRRVAELEADLAEVMLRYHELAGSAEEARELERRLRELRAKQARREPIETDGEEVTAVLAELGCGPFDRYGRLPQRVGRWVVYATGRAEPVEGWVEHEHARRRAPRVGERRTR